MINVRCEICASTNTEEVTIRRSLDYVICHSCGHCLLSPGTSTLEEICASSQKKYFGESTILIEAGESPLEEELMAQRRGIVSEFVKPKSRILEVGPGAGAVLSWLNNQGHMVTAVEESAALGRVLESVTGTSIIVGGFEQNGLPAASHDVFCSFHVIEHVLDPRAHLLEAARIVRPGGLAFVATPNASSWEQRIFRRLSSNFDSAHLRVFSQKSLERLSTDCGWHILRSETPEYTSGWLRVASKAVRMVRGEDEEATAGKYGAGMSRKARRILTALAWLTWPLRAAQRQLKGGNEIFLVLQRNT